GLSALDGMPSEDVASYQPYWALRGHLLKRLERTVDARGAFERAMVLSQDPAVRDFLRDSFDTASESALTPAYPYKEGAMAERLISGDNHIDLTYCPPDLWSSQAPAKWKLIAPRTEELEDGLHWFVNAQDKGMWNGVGPGFLKYQKGTFGHIDE